MIRPRVSTLLVALAAAVGLLGTFPLAAAAAVPAAAERIAPAAVRADGSDDLDDFTFDSFDADYTLTRADDGTSRLTVVETLVALFPEYDQNHGIERAIPNTYNGQPVEAHLVSVTDETGAPRDAEVRHLKKQFSVISRTDGFVHGLQTYVITYTLENVVWDFPDTGLEFFWDVNGVGWAQSFGYVTARLHLAPDLASQLSGRMACYQGDQDSKAACDSITQGSDIDGGVVISADALGLAPYQTLTMAVGFRPDTFALFDRSSFASPLGWAQAVAGIGAIGAGMWGLCVRRRRLADAPGRPTIIPEYTPPTVVDALESAVLLRRQNKAIPAEVLEQAVSGSLRIVEGGRTWTGRTRLIAELVDPSHADSDGGMLLAGLFPSGTPGEQYEFGKHDTRFSSAAQKILSAADKELTTRGLRGRASGPGRVGPMLASAAALGLSLVFGIAAIDHGVDPIAPLVVIALAAALFIAVVCFVTRRPLSALGAETRDHLRGLEQFIAWAEADRIRMLQSPSGAERVPVDVSDPRQKLALYEKLLPYAVVFGQEKEWSKELAALYSAVGTTSPYWYAGTGSFNVASFSAGIGTLSSAASASSSTSGGSGGGGSAGGGGGGGGGGGV